MFSAPKVPQRVFLTQLQKKIQNFFFFFVEEKHAKVFMVLRIPQQVFLGKLQKTIQNFFSYCFFPICKRKPTKLVSTLRVPWWVFPHPSSFFHLFFFLFFLMFFVFTFEFGYKKKSFQANLGAENSSMGFFPHSSSSSSNSFTFHYYKMWVQFTSPRSLDQ